MQRTHSLTSISTANSARYKNGDLSTESLISDNGAFARKSRKQDVPSNKVPTYSFPNGEIFTPRMGPSKRARPPKIAADPPKVGGTNLQPRLPRSSSMVSVRAAPIYELPHGGPHGNPHGNPHENLHVRESPHETRSQTRPAGSFLVRSHSYHNVRQRTKQDLAFNLRNTKIDTPTNISVPQLSASAPLTAHSVPPQSAPAQLRSHSLTNNRYAENASNIVRQNALSSSGSSLGEQDSLHGQHNSVPRMDSAPSSVSNYNLHRSDSNTPQTSVSGSESALEHVLKSWSSSESVSSFRTARDPSPLSSIDETAVVHSSEVIDGAPSSLDVPSGNVSPVDSVKGSADQFGLQDGLKSSDAHVEVPRATTVVSEDAPHATGVDYVDSVDTGVLDDVVTANIDHPLEPPGLPHSQISSNTTLDQDTMESETTTLKHGESTGSTAELIDDAEDPERSGISVQPNQDSLPKPASESTRRLSSSNHTTVEGSEFLQSHSLSTSAEKFVDGTLMPSKTETKENFSAGNSVNQVYLRSEVSKDAKEEVREENESKREPSENSDDKRDISEALSQNTPEKSIGAVGSPHIDDVSEMEPPAGGAGDRLKMPPVSSLKERRKLEISPITTSLYTTSAFASSPDVSTPSLENSPRASQSDSDLPGLVERLVTLETLDENEMAEPIPSISQTTTHAFNGKTSPQMLSNFRIEVNDLYSPSHIDRFLTDDQEAVPRRRDVAVKNGAIEFHSRNPSIVSSDSPSQLISQEVYSTNYDSQNSNEKYQTRARDHKIVTPTARESMLAVVDVDYERLLPPTPTKDFFSKPSADDEKLATITEGVSRKASKHERSPAGKPTTSRLLDGDSNPGGLKKLFRFMKFGSKQGTPSSPKLRWKSSASSLPSTPRLNQPTARDRRSQQVVTSHSDKSPSSLHSSKHTGARTRGFVSTLKSTSGSKVHDLPSPVYSVRERASSPDLAAFSSIKESNKFDLPEYNVESDSFGDVLLKFQEVEKEIENEVQVFRNSKGKHDFFLKDDELTKAQIFDQQAKDTQLSNESLPGKLDSQSSSASTFDTTVNDDEFDDSAVSAEQKTYKKLRAFPQDTDVVSVTLTNSEVSATLTEKYDARHSYLKLVRQFSDYDKMNVNLSGFDPMKTPKPASSAGAKKSSFSGTTEKPRRNVKFAESISISETYAPYMYKRYNKSVTQYYLTDFSEINRIKNELNSYKCYEMLVHEKSQANTHFFY